MKLDDDKQARAGIVHTLRKVYGKMCDTDRLQGLLQAMADCEVDSVVDAIDKHVVDARTGEDGKPVGYWPPRPAQLVARIYAAKEEDQRRADAAADEERRRVEGTARRGNRRVPLVLDESVYQMFPSLRKITHTWTSNCKDCGDTGMARFYYMPNDEPKARQDVYLGSEAIALPEAIARRLRATQALCDCQRGSVREEKGWTYQAWSDRHGEYIALPTYPRMRRIRALAESRRKRDRETIGAPNAAASIDVPAPARPAGDSRRRDAAREGDAVGTRGNTGGPLGPGVARSSSGTAEMAERDSPALPGSPQPPQTTAVDVSGGPGERRRIDRPAQIHPHAQPAGDALV